MKLLHATKVFETLVHEGQKFTADAEGVFDVPDEVGHTLLNVHGWKEAVGEVTTEAKQVRADADQEIADLRDQLSKAQATAESKAAAEVTELRSTVAALTAQVEKLAAQPAPAPAPAKAPAAKSTTK